MNPSIKRILVPLDFSEHSDLALRYAMTLAERLEASLDLLHVVDNSVPLGWGGEMWLTTLPELQTTAVEDAERRIAECHMLAKGATPNVTTSVVLGYPAKAIVEAATSLRSNLVVIGTHGRAGFAHLLMGSVAEKVVRLAPCPVLTVRDTARKAESKPAKAAASVA